MLLALHIQCTLGDANRNRRFNVKFMKWEEYRNIILSGSTTEEWNTLSRYDCVFGGNNLDMNYLYVIP